MSADNGSWREGSWGESSAEGSMRAPSFSSALNTEVKGFNAPTHPQPKAKKEEGDNEKEEWLAILRFLSTRKP